MHRCCSGIFLLLAIIFAVPLTGCLGKSSSNNGSQGVESVSLSPTGDFSMDIGTTQVFSASARNANGGTVLGADIQYIVQSGSPNSAAPLSIASNGNACAGTWDASFAVCSPGSSGVALVSAVSNGVSSAQTTVYVHQHITSIQIQSAETQPQPYDCFSQGQTWVYQATSYNSNNVDISDTVGPLDWSFSNLGVVTTTPFVPPQQPNVLNQIQTTAKAPGITQIFASISGTTSTPFAYSTCLIQAVYLQIAGQSEAGNSITVNNGGAVSVTAIAVDSLCGIANQTPLSNPPLTWSTTDPEVMAFSTTASTALSNSATARNNLGGATITASCTPPSCNIGVLPGAPVYASNYDVNASPAPKCQPVGLAKGYGAISVDVISSTIPPTPPTYTAWAATTGCQNVPGCSSALFAVTPGTTPISTIVGLPRTPNSLMFNHLAASRLYIGSNQGLMYVDVNGASPTVNVVSNQTTPCNVSLCGKVLAISNDGKLAVVSDTISTPSQVYIYNGSGGTTPVDLIVPGESAVAAAFSPDQMKVFILTDTGNMYVYSTVDALTSVPIATSVTDVKFAADGSFAYIAGTPASSVSGYSTCGLPNVASTNIGTVTASTTPSAIFPSPVLPLPVLQGGTLLPTQQSILALEPPTGSNANTSIEFLTAEFSQDPLLYQLPGAPLNCNPPTMNSFTRGPLFNLGQGALTPVFQGLVDDGAELIIVARKVGAVLVFNVANGTTTSIPLVGNGTDPLSADASTDGSQVYVATCDQYAQDGVTCAAGSVHIVDTISQGDLQQVPYVNINNDNDTNMCNNQGGTAAVCFPNLIAIKPQ